MMFGKRGLDLLKNPDNISLDGETEKAVGAFLSFG